MRSGHGGGRGSAPCARCAPARRPWAWHGRQEPRSGGAAGLLMLLAAPARMRQNRATCRAAYSCMPWSHDMGHGPMDSSRVVLAVLNGMLRAIFYAQIDHNTPYYNTKQVTTTYIILFPIRCSKLTVAARCPVGRQSALVSSSIRAPSARPSPPPKPRSNRRAGVRPRAARGARRRRLPPGTSRVTLAHRRVTLPLVLPPARNVTAREHCSGG